MKRAVTNILAALSLGAAGGLAQAQAPAPGAAPAAAAPAAKPTPAKATGRVAVFNVAKVMRDYKNWQHFAIVMNNKRTTASGELVKLRESIAALQAKGQSPATLAAEKEAIPKQLVELQRQFEDKERTYRADLDKESAGYLRNLFAEIQACVRAIVESNGCDIVFAYPDAITQEELTSPLYYDLKLRPPAAMPFYISENADITNLLIATLNENFKPPADSPVHKAQPVVPPTPAPQPK